MPNYMYVNCIFYSCGITHTFLDTSCQCLGPMISIPVVQCLIHWEEIINLFTKLIIQNLLIDSLQYFEIKIVLISVKETLIAYKGQVPLVMPSLNDVCQVNSILIIAFQLQSLLHAGIFLERFESTTIPVQSIIDLKQSRAQCQVKTIPKYLGQSVTARHCSLTQQTGKQAQDKCN